MTTGVYRGEALALADVHAADLARKGVVFTDGRAQFLTTGEHFAKGGMGDLYRLARLQPDGTEDEVVGKVFQSEYLYQLRTDPVTREDHARNVRAMEQIAALDHPNLLPTLVSAPIADNHLTVSPMAGKTLASAVAEEDMPVRDRVGLLLDALQGLAALHDTGILHRDFTLRNVLLARDNTRAYLFDFDLALCVDDVADETIREHYRGRIFGSPGYSVPPEILDPQLMTLPIARSLDMYAVGGALFALFTDALPYGDTEDMWGLYLRIADGVVGNGESRIVYPGEVPRPLRPLIERCLERDPGQRFGSLAVLMAGIRDVLGRLPKHAAAPAGYRNTLRYGAGGPDARSRLVEVFTARRDPSVSLPDIEVADAALSKHGYQIQRSLGRVKKHPIYVAAPVPILLASGQFPDANTYPKIVTAVDLSRLDAPDEFVDLWLGGYLPILRSVRQGMMTALFRAVHDEDSNYLFLFSEYVDDARFGGELLDLELSLEEALGLAYLIALQVQQLHRRGLAHNNVRSSSLLLKGVRDAHRVVPAMVGLVEPSFDERARDSDVRNVAELALRWVRPQRIATTEPAVRTRLSGLRTYLQELVAGSREVAADIEDLVAALGTGIGAVDPNFSILVTYGGDLPAYALMLIQHRLYARLWL